MPSGKDVTLARIGLTGREGFVDRPGASPVGWWAPLELTRINIELTILHKKIAETRMVKHVLTSRQGGAGLWKRAFASGLM
jgi:hypothetical protein